MLLFLLLLLLKSLIPVLSYNEPLHQGEFHNGSIISHRATNLTGRALVDYVNRKQSLWKAEYISHSSSFLKKRLMDTKYFDDTRTEKIKSRRNLDVELPERFDAREKWPECPSISYIRDQSGCGSCWAVSSAGVMSDRACIQSNGTVKEHLSDTDILACCGESCGKGCLGGVMDKAFEYAMTSGVCTGGRYREQSCKPYAFYPCGQHQNQPFYGDCPDEEEGPFPTPKCRARCRLRYPRSYEEDKVFAESYYSLENDEKEIMYEIMTNGPVATTFMVYEDFEFYKTGVYEHTSGWLVGLHAVRVIGWGVEGETPYWLIANTWNTDWGENGYFRFLRGKDHCKIEGRMKAVMMKV
ncbi:unnamed protein product [Cylicocyclus nassatus]|uniref:Peptidase C1A papain C-terminal domain-containing protein n=1 Tax=Cylicocyclus nassatus TaxID=53992 RepID=A0AA36GL29_CYLNA|nr:unnamed protein product [Cylicocyclus nassatus]